MNTLEYQQAYGEKDLTPLSELAKRQFQGMLNRYWNREQDTVTLDLAVED